MMKPKDASIATALLIQGYLRANNADNDAAVEQLALRSVIDAIRAECDDWAENLRD